MFAGEPLPSQFTPQFFPKGGRCGSWFERQGRRAGYGLIAGVDEVGRGALFGPVLAAAVILDTSARIRGIQDSKRLPAREREHLSEKIRRRAIAWSITSVDAGEIDRINIYQASRLAMRLAVLELSPPPELVLVDALRLDIPQPQVPIIRGDSLSISIAAASIIAKVERDRLMSEWDRIYPHYQLARNKGYATAAHRAMLRELGPTPLHRYSYAPVAEASKKSTGETGILFSADI
ncbi:MAG: ribonuclease HII [Acidobacteria bacterium]|nr:ribonuclease HII [Acidobacteriota bacterium]